MLHEKQHWLNERDTSTLHIEKSPYDCDPYIRRSLCYEELAYPDLAAGDAYKALLLTDELLDESGEWHELAVEAVEPRIKKVDKVLANGATNGYNTSGAKSDDGHSDKNHEEEGSNGIDGEEEEENPWYKAIAEDYARRSYEILARTLSDCGDLKAAYGFTERGLKVFPGHDVLRELQDQILDKHRQSQLQKDPKWDTSDFHPRTDLPENGSARREIYPWNKHEIDRFSEDSMSFLNAEIRKTAPKCEVRAVDLPVLLDTQASHEENQKPATITQLGVFATTDIPPNETVLLEPSVLTSSTRLFDPFCDACSSALPTVDPDHALPTCPDCDDIVFCSEACLARAQDLYHPTVCGLPDFDIVAKDPSPFAASNALYTLLIARTLAMAETQNTHPLDLPQIKYLWGDFTPSGASPAIRSLPFSFENNIAQPLHLLSKLDKDPFEPLIFGRYDTWIINTLLAKFRGVANAKMNERTGMPEVAGVHWLWCLSNHSCAPNVRWAWEKGGMGLVARGADDAVRWGVDVGVEGRWKGGVRMGEEVLTHYCDVELGVRQRREWAVGPLGGICVCERCVWEEGVERRREVEEEEGGGDT